MRRGTPSEQPVSTSTLPREDLEGLKVRFPRQDPRLDHIAELPRLVVVQSDDNGRQEIAGAGWWGTADLNPAMTAAEASPQLVRAMARPDDPSHGKSRKPAKARRARWSDVALYAHGFVAPLIFAVAGFAAALALAAVAVLTVELPWWIAAAVLGLVTLVEGAKAIVSVLGALG